MEVREEIRLLAETLAGESGLELVDVEHASMGSRRVVRVLIDKPGGVTVGDCGLFSRRLSDCIDMNQVVPGAYQLEVSSPGVDRPIRTSDAVRRFAGERAAFTLHDLLDGTRRFDGELLGPEGDRPGVRTDDGTTHWFEWAQVKSIRLVVDPWARAREARASGTDGRQGPDAEGHDRDDARRRRA